MHNLRSFLWSRTVFLYLLPVFFVLHGYRQNFDFVPVKDALLLTGIYLLASLVLFSLSWLFYHNFYKASLLAFCIMAFHFFFGALHDLGKKIFDNSFLVKYSFILPFSFILFIVLVILSQKNKQKFFFKLTKYLNWVLLLLILTESGSLVCNISATRKNDTVQVPNGFSPCDSCFKPLIFTWLWPTNTAGDRELKDIFHFDNVEFENELRKRGFHIIQNSKSNYNSTVFP